MDAITLLAEDHQTVEQLFRQFEKLGPNATTTKRKVVDQIVKELSVHAAIEATQDPSAPVRPDVNLFNTVRIRLELGGVTPEQGGDLVERFKRR